MMMCSGRELEQGRPFVEKEVEVLECVAGFGRLTLYVEGGE